MDDTGLWKEASLSHDVAHATTAELKKENCLSKRTRSVRRRRRLRCVPGMLSSLEVKVL